MEKIYKRFVIRGGVCCAITSTNSKHRAHHTGEYCIAYAETILSMIYI